MGDMEKDFTKLNFEHICYVKSEIKQQAKSYTYFEETVSRFLFFKPVTQKVGFYEFAYPDYKYISNEKIEESGKLYCEGEKVFFKPFLRIIMSDGTSHNKFFNTTKELDLFMKSYPFSSITWID